MGPKKPSKAQERRSHPRRSRRSEECEYEYEHTPGPGEYNIQTADAQVYPNAPAYTLGQRSSLPMDPRIPYFFQTQNRRRIVRNRIEVRYEELLQMAYQAARVRNAAPSRRPGERDVAYSARPPFPAGTRHSRRDTAPHNRVRNAAPSRRPGERDVAYSARPPFPAGTRRSRRDTAPHNRAVRNRMEGHRRWYISQRGLSDKEYLFGFVPFYLRQLRRRIILRQEYRNRSPEREDNIPSTEDIEKIYQEILDVLSGKDVSPPREHDVEFEPYLPVEDDDPRIGNEDICFVVPGAGAFAKYEERKFDPAKLAFLREQTRRLVRLIALEREAAMQNDANVARCRARCAAALDKIDQLYFELIQSSFMYAPERRQPEYDIPFRATEHRSLHAAPQENVPHPSTSLAHRDVSKGPADPRYPSEFYTSKEEMETYTAVKKAWTHLRELGEQAYNRDFNRDSCPPDNRRLMHVAYPPRGAYAPYPPGEDYPPYPPGEGYPPHPPLEGYPPHPSGAGYPPYAPGEDYPPYAPGEDYPPYAPGEDYPPYAPGEVYPPYAPGEHYPPHPPRKGYPPHPSAAGYPTYPPGEDYPPYAPGEDYPPYAPGEDYPPYAPGEDYPPYAPGEDYPPHPPRKGYPPHPSAAGYPPYAPGEDYPPYAPGEDYPPHPPRKGYPPHPSAAGYPPYAPGEDYPPYAPGEDYPPHPPRKGYPPQPSAAGYPLYPPGEDYPPHPRGEGYPPYPSGEGNLPYPPGEDCPPHPRGEGYPPYPSGEGNLPYPPGEGYPPYPAGDACPPYPPGEEFSKHGLFTHSRDVHEGTSDPRDPPEFYSPRTPRKVREEMDAFTEQADIRIREAREYMRKRYTELLSRYGTEQPDSKDVHPDYPPGEAFPPYPPGEGYTPYPPGDACPPYPPGDACPPYPPGEEYSKHRPFSHPGHPPQHEFPLHRGDSEGSDFWTQFGQGIPRYDPNYDGDYKGPFYDDTTVPGGCYVYGPFERTPRGSDAEPNDLCDDDADLTYYKFVPTEGRMSPGGCNVVTTVTTESIVITFITMEVPTFFYEHTFNPQTVPSIIYPIPPPQQERSASAETINEPESSTSNEATFTGDRSGKELPIIEEPNESDQEKIPVNVQSSAEESSSAQVIEEEVPFVKEVDESNEEKSPIKVPSVEEDVPSSKTKLVSNVIPRATAEKETKRERSARSVKDAPENIENSPEDVENLTESVENLHLTESVGHLPENQKALEGEAPYREESPLLRESEMPTSSSSMSVPGFSSSSLGSSEREKQNWAKTSVLSDGPPTSSSASHADELKSQEKKAQEQSSASDLPMERSRKTSGSSRSKTKSRESHRNSKKKK